MKKERFAVIDIEATGMGESHHRIIEIAVVVLEIGSDGPQVVDHFESLINPDIKVSHEIEKLTGISNSELIIAPRFVDVAATIELLTRDATIVAHGARCDFEMLQSHFEIIGIDYKRRYLCTQVLAKSNDPGLPAYDLKSLCVLYDIDLKEHHRALPDALACASLFMRIYGPKLQYFSLESEIIFKFLKRYPCVSFQEVNLLKSSDSLVFLYKENRIVGIHAFERGHIEVLKILLRLPENSFDRMSVKSYEHHLLALVDAVKLKKRFRPKLKIVSSTVDPGLENYPQDDFALEFGPSSLIFRDNKLIGRKQGSDFWPIHETKAMRSQIISYLRNSRNAKVRKYSVRTLKKITDISP